MSQSINVKQCIGRRGIPKAAGVPGSRQRETHTRRLALTRGGGLLSLTPLFLSPSTGGSGERGESEREIYREKESTGSVKHLLGLLGAVVAAGSAFFVSNLSPPAPAAA